MIIVVLSRKGKMKMLDYKDDPETWEKGYNLLYTCNHREINH